MDSLNLHHHGPHTICLKQHPNLSEDELDEFFAEYFNRKNILSLNLSHQENLQNSHLDLLSKSVLGKSLRRLNLQGCPNISYEGIVFLWKSPILGSIIDEEPIYESYYNKPISLVTVEIGNTKALNQYQTLVRPDGKQIFPLPLLDKFNISYINLAWANNISSRKEVGFKKLIITNDGTPVD